MARLQLAGRIAICCSLALGTSLAVAGKVVKGEGRTLEEAMEAATRNVEADARAAKRCVSEYPKTSTCSRVTEDKFVCQGVRANHKGSCK